MRAIDYTTIEECVHQWNELEDLVKHLHEIGTDKYTYIENNILILEPHPIYDSVVNEWIGEKETIKYQKPIQEEDENNY